jgi:hypothetical protein
VRPLVLAVVALAGLVAGAAGAPAATLAPNATWIYQDSPVSGVVARSDDAGHLQFTSFCAGVNVVGITGKPRAYHWTRPPGRTRVAAFGFPLYSVASLAGGARAFALIDVTITPDAHQITALLRKGNAGPNTRRATGYPKPCVVSYTRPITLVRNAGPPLPLAPAKPLVAPAPAVPAPGQSSLSLACPPATAAAPWLAGTPYPLAGQLAPAARAGDTITVGWTDAAGPHTTTALTTAGGRFSATVFFFGSVAQSTFAIGASFAGDLPRAASSATCNGAYRSSFTP